MILAFYCAVCYAAAFAIHPVGCITDWIRRYIGDAEQEFFFRVAMHVIAPLSVPVAVYYMLRQGLWPGWKVVALYTAALSVVLVAICGFCISFTLIHNLR